MRPGAPGQLQLNPFKVRLTSMMLRNKAIPKIAGVYPGRPMMMPGMGRIGGMGMPRMPMGLGAGMPRTMGMGAGMGLPKPKLSPGGF